MTKAIFKKLKHSVNFNLTKETRTASSKELCDQIDN